jgi:hypothetical protein
MRATRRKQILGADPTTVSGSGLARLDADGGVPLTPEHAPVRGPKKAGIQLSQMRAPHSHCPFGHDHPQPFALADVQPDPAHQRYAGKTFCGACWHRDGEMVEMVLCTPETCPGDFAAQETR